MYKLLLLFVVVGALRLSAQNTRWELSLRTEHKSSFEKAYQSYPSIPKGILEAISYNSTHIRHINPEVEMKSCIGLPYYYGVMGLVVDSSRYFKNTLQLVANQSKVHPEIIKTDPEAQIMAYAATYDHFCELLNIQSSSPTDHIPVIEALSELPNNGQAASNFAFQSHVYAILMHLNHATFQQTFQTPTYTIDIEKYFGSDLYRILSSPNVSIDHENAYDSSGHTVPIHGYRNSSLPCNDLGNSFNYVLIQDPADPSNFSSRNGSAITNVTIHTIQGSYAGAISWFKNPSSNVSCHYNMRSTDGQVTQMVCEADKAWHASGANPFSIGIEHEGYVADPSWYTQVTYLSSAQLTKSFCNRYNIPLNRVYDINGDHGLNHNSNTCFRVKGHQHYPTNNHTDPGKYWDWNYYYDLINPASNVPNNTYSNCSGTFTDPGGTGNYTNDERTIYRIEPAGATEVSLTFSMLDLEANYDYLYIYDGQSQNDELIAVLNGTSLPNAITAKTGKLYIEFRSDCGTTAAGWTASWTCSTQAQDCPAPTGLTTSNTTPNQVRLNWLTSNGALQYEIKTKRTVNNLTDDFNIVNTNSYDWLGIAANARYLWSVRSICANNDTSAWSGSEFINTTPLSDQTVTTCQGKFTDSGGQVGGYLNNEEYTYVIAPNNGSNVQVIFNSFDLESNYDFLSIYDGNSISANLIGTYTGANSPGIVQSSNGALCFKFTSDNRTQNAGWDADWSCTSTTGLSNVIYLDQDMIADLNCGTSYHELFDSGGDTSTYGNNEDFVQTFCHPDSTKSVRISFRPNPTADQQLSLRSSTTGNDYLYIYNGASTQDNIVGVYTGSSSSSPQAGTFISSGACLTVRMTSDNMNVADGFKARLYCSDRPSQLTMIEVGGPFGNQTITDLGGSSGLYSNNENYTQTICPHSSIASNEGVWLDFTDTVFIEKNWDYLYVFDGPDTENARLINKYTGDSSNSNVLGMIKSSVDNSSGCLTLQFYSDGATAMDGWTAEARIGKKRETFGTDLCLSATAITKENTVYAGSTNLSTGTPGLYDPSLNISLPNLPNCSGANTITRLENSVWYTFTTVDSFCVADQISIKLNNISCQSNVSGLSGVQFILYEQSSCQQGSQWGSPIYCADKLVNGDSVVITQLLQPNTTYYVLIDGFAGQHCNFDISLNNSGMQDCMILPISNSELSIQKLNVYPIPSRDFIYFELLDAPDGDYHISIFNTAGEQLLKINNRTTSNSIREKLDISQLATGLYFYQCQLGEQFLQGKFKKN